MKMRNLKQSIGGALLGFAILFGIGIASSTTAQAQYRNDDYYRRQQREYEREQRRRQREWEREQRRRQREAARSGGYYGTYPNNGGYYGDGYGYGGGYDLRQTALNAGYNEGIKEGREDRQRGERFNYADESDYREASKDYNSRFGNRALYQQYFRQAFINGYTDGYRGY